jgi:hypothetical protein
MAWRNMTLFLVALLACVPRLASAQDRPPDEISQLLFDTYLARAGKFNTSTVIAASHIVAERGRESGFWRNVLAELMTGDEHSEVHCVRILGNMLATDAAARDTIRRQKETGETSARIASVNLGPEVVAELLARGQKADRFRIDHYTIALARARVPEARDFFTSILRAEFPQPQGEDQGTVPAGRVYHLQTTRYHAAVGLAQLGERAGVEWLIAHSEDIQGDVSSARPYGSSRGGSLGSCCVAALEQLSEKRDLTTKAEWEAWWKTADKRALLKRAVALADP